MQSRSNWISLSFRIVFGSGPRKTTQVPASQHRRSSDTSRTAASHNKSHHTFSVGRRIVKHFLSRQSTPRTKETNFKSGHSTTKPTAILGPFEDLAQHGSASFSADLRNLESMFEGFEATLVFASLRHAYCLLLILFHQLLDACRCYPTCSSCATSILVVTMILRSSRKVPSKRGRSQAQLGEAAP